MEVKIAHAIGHKPAPDIGWGAKFSAFLVGTAGVAGLATAAFGGPIVGGVASATGSAAASTAAKVAEAAGVTEGIRTLKDIGMQIGVAYGGDKVTELCHHRYNYLGCTSMIDSPECFVYRAGVVTGGLIIIFSAYVLFRIAYKQGQKYL